MFNVLHKKVFAITTVCIILGIMIAWQYKSIYINKSLSTSQYQRLEDVKDELLMEKSNNEKLRKRNEDIVKQNKELENAKGSNDAYEKNLKNELERTRTIACLNSVTGKGVIVKIAGDFADVYETDILLLINELRASGAQAISVNDERITVTSEIRKGGNYIVINGKQFRPPFIIKAISAPEKTTNVLNMVGGIIERLEWYKLQITVESKDKITIPKASDDGNSIRYDMLTPIN